jgi:hypothetical protein
MLARLRAQPDIDGMGGDTADVGASGARGR